MMLVIPYRATKDDGTELKYCIRSMVKYFKDMTGVLVIGDKPSWYSGEHIQAKDIFGQKELSIINKLLLTSGTVLLSSDDVYALHEFDISLPQYYSRTCKQKSIIVADHKYRKLYKACPPHWLNFDIHQPMVIDTDKYRSLDIKNLPIKTQYANNFPGVQVQSSENKIKGPTTYLKLRTFIQGRIFFSSSAITAATLQLLSELYPDKSEYEQ